MLIFLQSVADFVTDLLPCLIKDQEQDENDKHNHRPKCLFDAETAVDHIRQIAEPKEVENDNAGHDPFSIVKDSSNHLHTSFFSCHNQ